ncbi:MAG: ZIP family metal transporter [Nanoarchaeota archaeon]|nr:ZIP family metal transporter [Nanoarchaeota archaeon]
MDNFYAALISAFVVSFVSLVGIVFIFFRKNKIEKFLFVLVAFAAGALIGDVFFHIIPESLEKLTFLNMLFFLISGFLFFYIIELFLHWHHPHKNFEGHSKETKHFSYLNLVGDGFHNFLDGALIAISYSVNFSVGIATTFAVIAHEIPQEIGDFAILVYGGFTKIKALVFNLLSALLAIIGVIFVSVGVFENNYSIYLLPIIAGGFLYISFFDLIPEISKNRKTSKENIYILLFLIFGLFLMFILKLFF